MSNQISTPHRADAIIPGDMIDLKTWSVGDFVRVLQARYIEHAATAPQVEITFESTDISPTRTYRADRLLDVLSV